MAGSRIKGITIEIDGNTTKLTESLKKVDSALKDTESQLKDVNKLLKLDPSNTELLKQKQELLAKAVKGTKERQEELKKALEQSKNAGDTEENRKQQDLLQRELIETTDKLKDLEKQYGKCSPALEAISAKTGELADKTKGLSAGAAVLGGGMVAMAVNAGKAADELKTTAQVTGFSVEELQKLQYAADLVDVSYETMTGSITKVTKAMSSGSKVFDKLGISITNQDGSMRDAKDVWYEALEALGQIENETERDAVSMELFGKSAMEMAGIVDDGGQKLKTLGEEAQNAGLIMSEDAVNGAGQFNDALDTLKARASAAFAEAGATLADTLIPALEWLVEKVSAVLEWFGNLDGTTQTVILVILGLVAALSPLLSLISTITAVLPALGAAFTFITGPVGIVVAAVGALIAVGVALYKNWDTIKAKATELWQKIKDTFDRIKQGIADRITAIKDKVTTTFENIKEAIMRPIEKAKEFISGIVEKIKGFFDFKIELPKIKMPHFAITPAGWKIGDLLKGSIPKLGIEWYAKAMNGGMVLNSPTIFGAQNGHLLAGGEAGPEVVVGQNSLMQMIRTAAAGAGDITVNVVVNGNVDNYDAMAEVIGQKLQQQMARQGRAFA